VSAVLLIADDETLADLVTRGLSAAGFFVATTTFETRRRAPREDFGTILLDLVSLPLDWQSVFAQVQLERQWTPITALVAVDATVGERVAVLDAGAVDCLGRPFAMRELAARIRARSRSWTPEVRVQVGEISLNHATREVWRDGERVHLSTRELELLSYFIRRRGEVCSRAEICVAVWGHDRVLAGNTIDAYVSYLRRKLGQPGRPLQLVSVRSIGYSLL
jgi:two-component system, OmpR family, response regulator